MIVYWTPLMTSKYTGDLEEVKRVRRELDLPAEHEEKSRG